jgi:hypothetical protein
MRPARHWATAPESSPTRFVHRPGPPGQLRTREARTAKDASITVAFFAVAGFAAGFSERFAADVLQRASSGILPTTQGKQAVEKPDELSLLLSEQTRHARTPVTQERQTSVSTATES